METFRKLESYFTGLMENNSSKWAVRQYQSSANLFKHLQSRSFSEDEMSEIEKVLSEIDFTQETTNQRKHIRGSISKFQAFLTKRFKLVTKGYYTSLGIIFGPGIGLSIGLAFDPAYGTSIGISVGVGFALIIGAYYDKKAQKEGRVLGC